MTQQFVDIVNKYSNKCGSGIGVSIKTIFGTQHRYLKYISLGIVAYSTYKLIQFGARVYCKNKNNNNNTNKIKKKELRELPEYTKYDNGFYAEYDELKLKNLQDEDDDAEMLRVRNPIREVTPRGEILMYYDKPESAFIYYSNNKNMPYRTLDAVARKYVCENNILSVYVDIRDELKKGCAKYAAAAAATNATSENKKVSSSIYAVFKNYKSGIRVADGAPRSVGGVENNNKKVILKDNVNKFMFKGRIDDYALDLKTRDQKEQNKKEKDGKRDEGEGEGEEGGGGGKEINLSYSEYKNKNKNRV